MWGSPRWPRAVTTIVVSASLVLSALTTSAVARATGPVVDPIPDRPLASGLGVRLEPVATLPASNPTVPRARVNHTAEVPDASGRLHAPDLNGTLHLLAGGEARPYLDVAATIGPAFRAAPGLGTGLGSAAFHPDFADNGRFYTVHTEAGDTPATFDFPHSGPVALQGVVTEWTATDPSADVFAGDHREVLRLAFPTHLHGIQQIGFDPTLASEHHEHGLLYVAVGDGERVPNWSDAPRDRTSPRGKILRIDPAARGAGRGGYGIPSGNPFVGESGARGEVYASGLRNPHRFSFDAADGRMFLGHIGEKQVEAIYDVRRGDDFGWNVREGGFLFRPNDPTNVYPLPADDARFGFTYPVAEYHNPTDGVAVVGGHVYRGERHPELSGWYVFGDVVNGRLFTTRADEMVRGGDRARIHELAILDDRGQVTTLRDLVGHDRVDLRLGQDAVGELYVSSKATGDVWRIAEVERIASCGPADTQVTDVMAARNWEPLTPSRWRFSGGEAALIEPGTPRPGPRRPHEYALLTAGPRFGAVMVDAEVRLDTPVTGRGEDVVLIFGHRSETRFYYVHLSDDAGDAAHNGIFLVDGADRVRIDDQWDGNHGAAAALPDNDYHRVRLVHCPDTGHIAVHLDGSRIPLLTATDRTISSGRVGFGSFDNTGRIRSVTVRGDGRLRCPATDSLTFRDVAAGSVHAANIRCGAELTLFEGRADGAFRPAATLTRAQAATVIDRIASASGHNVVGARTRFGDVGDSPHRDAIERLAGAGIINGYRDGTFRPSAPVTRAQLASLLIAFLERTSGQTLPAGARFTDVPAGSTHDLTLRKARAAGIVQGDDRDRAAPNDPIRRDQAASLFVRSLPVLPTP